MTPEELRVKLLELDGWKLDPDEWSFTYPAAEVYVNKEGDAVPAPLLPKLTLDYIATLEAKLTDEEHARFSASLRDLTYDIDVAKWNRAYISPSKEQRAAAILRAAVKGDK